MATLLTPDVDASSLTVSPAERFADGVVRTMVVLRLVNTKGLVLTDRAVSFTCLPENSVDISPVTRAGETYTTMITAREGTVLPTVILEVAVDNKKLEGLSAVVHVGLDDEMSPAAGALSVTEASQGNGKVNLPQLRKCFNAWKVPTEDSFSWLIDVASLSFKSGEGIAGGEPSTESGVVDVSGVTPWHVKVSKGVTMAQEGIALNLPTDGGLILVADKLGVKMAAGVNVVNDGMVVVTSGALKMGGDVSITLDETKGLKQDDKGHVKIHVDPALFDVENGLRLVCQPLGGLCLDAQGELVLDIDTIMNVSI